MFPLQRDEPESETVVGVCLPCMLLIAGDIDDQPPIVNRDGASVVVQASGNKPVVVNSPANAPVVIQPQPSSDDGLSKTAKVVGVAVGLFTIYSLWKK